MTDPSFPSDPDKPRDGESEPWSWQRPNDGSPVYGDPSSSAEPPPPPTSEPAGYEPPPFPGSQPGIGPAQPGHHHPAQGAQSGPWDYQQQQQGWQEAPPQQWSAQGSGAPPPAGYGAPYGGNYPPPPAPPTSSVNRGMFSLFLGLISTIFFCCWPLAIIGGIAGAVLGWVGMKEAKSMDRMDVPAIIGFWLSLAALV